MKIILFLALAFALHAEGARPVCVGGNPPPDQNNCRPASDLVNLPTVEQLTAKLAEKSKQIAEQEAELTMLRNGLGQCQATVIHQNAVMQVHAQAQMQSPAKPPVEAAK